MGTSSTRWFARSLAAAVLCLTAMGATVAVADAQPAPAQAGPASMSAAITSADINPAAGMFSTTLPAGQLAVIPASSGDGTPAGAVQWYQAHLGSTAWENYCEKAAENSYGTTGVWASAIAHWNGASPKHAGNYSPPLGSFVYWNISAYGHVGISDGKGGAYATSVSGKIGHITSLNYFAKYLGWTPAAVPHQ